MQFTGEHEELRRTWQTLIDREINPYVDEWEKEGIFPAHELFPKLGSPNYQTEISRLATARPDVIFSNLWGADLENFVRQASPRGLFTSSHVEVREGLRENEMVVQKAGAFLREGDRVRPIAADVAK